MKLMNHFMIACVVFMLNACSTGDTVTLEEQETVDFQTKSLEEEQIPYVYLEELHYMHLITEFGEDHPLVPIYRDYFEEVAAGVKPGSGCPSPKPCDVGGIGNCKVFSFENLEGFLDFSQMEEVSVGFFNSEGEPVNELNQVMATKCPTKKSIFYGLAEPLQGEGYFEISFASELTEGEMVEFIVPFQQQ